VLDSFSPAIINIIRRDIAYSFMIPTAVIPAEKTAISNHRSEGQGSTSYGVASFTALKTALEIGVKTV
jgi:hypothetical protein